MTDDPTPNPSAAEGEAPPTPESVDPPQSDVEPPGPPDTGSPFDREDATPRPNPAPAPEELMPMSQSEADLLDDDGPQSGDVPAEHEMFAPPRPVETISTGSPFDRAEDLRGGRGRATGSSRRRWLGVSLVSALVGAAIAVGATIWLDDGNPADSGGPPVTIVERVETQILNPSEGGSVAAAVAQTVLPTIVTVEVREDTGGEFEADGSGSGVVIDTSGLLVTNQHVVDGAGEVRVVFEDGRIYEAEIVGEDALTDLAVIRISAVGLTAIEFGASERMNIGDAAIAIGSPLGLGGGPSVTVGVLSAVDRRVRTSADSELFGLLQTDAPITRGSSGGALVDDAGRLIGITSAIGVSDVGAEGLGFAIPVEMVTRITDDIIEFGEVRHAFLGITGDTYFNEQADGAQVPAGVVVVSVVPDSAAAVSGLEAGDVIRSFDDRAVTTMEALVVDLRFFKVGQSIEVSLERDGEAMMLSVELLERPEGV